MARRKKWWMSKRVWSEVKNIEKDREAIDKKVEEYLKELKYVNL